MAINRYTGKTGYKEPTYSPTGEELIKVGGEEFGVPLDTFVPYASFKPPRAYKIPAEAVRAITDLLPYVTAYTTEQYKPYEEAKLGAAQAVSPGYAQLMSELLSTYGPQLTQTGTALDRQKALETQKTQEQLLAGAGPQTQQALDLMKLVDPEYFSTKANTAGQLNNLFGSIDLTGALSPSERAEIERANNIEGMRRGTMTAPSVTDTVSNAIRFGEAGKARQVQAQDALTKAIAAATTFMPASRTGFDTAGLALNPMQAANTGLTAFTGIKSPGTEASESASQWGQGALDIGNQIYLAGKAKSNSPMNWFSSAIGALGSLGGASGLFAKGGIFGG